MTTTRADRRVLPLWVHQVAEYVVGLLLAEMALHVSGQMETALLAAAGAMVAIGAFTDGPIGALRLLGPRAHQGADVGLAVGLAVSPLAVSGHLDTLAIVVAEAAAVILLRMATLTRYRAGVPAPDGGLMMRTAKLAASAAGPPPRSTQPPARDGVASPRAGAGSGARAGSVIRAGSGTRAGVARAEHGNGPAGRPSSGRTARTLGFLAGRAQREGRRQAPRAERAVGAGARRLGAVVGRHGSLGGRRPPENHPPHD